MTPPAMATAAAKPLPVLLDAAPWNGLAGVIGAPEELGVAAPELDGYGAPVPDG